VPALHPRLPIALGFGQALTRRRHGGRQLGRLDAQRAQRTSVIAIPNRSSIIFE